MNSILANIIDKYCPKFNKDITEGVAKDILNVLPNELSNIFRDSITTLNAQVPLKYMGYRKITPEDEFKNLVMSSSSKTTYDIAVSDIYPVEYVFDFAGEEIRKPIYLIYCDRGNTLKISNTIYSIVPVLSDTVITPSHKEVFVRLLKDKIHIRSSDKNFVLNGERISGPVIYATIVKTNGMNIVNNLGSHYTSIYLYILGKYGLKETLRRYMCVKDFIITTGDVENYRDTYNIWESIKVKPKTHKNSSYIGHNLKICINKKYKLTTDIENLVYTIIYTLDVLPEEADNIVYGINNSKVQDEIMQWRILLGKISYRNSFSIDRIIQDMNDHFEALEGYVDTFIQNKLIDNGIKVNDFFDLLMVIGQNYNNWLLNSKEYNSDINNRYIDIVYYLLYDIIIGFNKVILNLNKRAGKKADGMTKKEAMKIIQNNLPSKVIFKLVKTSEPNIAIQAQNDSSTDLIYPKITALLEDQSRGNGVRRGKNSQFPESTKTLKGHDLYLGTLLFLNKNAPSPRFRANMYMEYNIKSGKLVIPDKLANTISKLDHSLRGKAVENKYMQVLEE